LKKENIERLLYQKPPASHHAMLRSRDGCALAHTLEKKNISRFLRMTINAVYASRMAGAIGRKPNEEEKGMLKSHATIKTNQ
jgi:hypothetical protein